MRMPVPFPRSSRRVEATPSEVSDVSALSRFTEFRRWRRRSGQTNVRSSISSLSSGPKSPTTPHSFAALQESLQNATPPAVEAPMTPAAVHFPSDPPPFSSRPGTRAGAGVRFAEVEDPEQGSPRSRSRRRSKARWWQIASWEGIKKQLISLCLSGIVLAVTLSVYLALSLTDRLQSSSFHVLLILILLIASMFFCHALVRLCIIATNPHRHRRDSLPFDFLGTDMPTEPIRIHQPPSPTGESPKVPPPAYGLWRYSVRVDPSQLVWVRNENAESAPEMVERPPTARRPPSYISEDGVRYVIEAEPVLRTTAADALPPHPSEVGR